MVNNLFCPQTNRKYFSRFVTMKLVLGLLTIYFLVLSALPCRDAGDDLHLPILTTKAHTDSAAEPHKHGGHAHQNDGCSPFCSCQCCSLKMETLQKFEAGIGKKIVLQLTVAHYELDAPSIDNYPNQIWQPPKYIA